MKRREFLRLLASASAATAAFAYGNPFRPRFRFARAATGKTLVVVFQRGGCDGLNTVVPYGDEFYYSTLRSTIAVAPPNPADPTSAIDLDGFFGLHPGLAALAPLYAAGKLAVLPAVQYANASRSHFDGQRFIESAAVDKNLDGWLNRHLVTLPLPAALRAVGFGSAVPHALRGQEIVSAFNDLASFDLNLPPAEEEALLTDLGRVYSQEPDNSKAYRSLVLSNGRVMVNDVAVLSGVDPATYTPANGAVYPNSLYGRQLKQVAQLIKEDLGLEVAALSLGGWDTHSNQGGGESGGRQTLRHQDFAGGIAALYTDLGSRQDDIVILTMTEFGRTAKENASGGTDHGHATSWFVAGGTVRGDIYGAWPGLATENLVNGRYLDHSIDFRDVMGEILSEHLGSTNLGQILPGHAYEPVGFLSDPVA